MSLLHPYKKFQFWSEIITQVWGEISVPAKTWTYVDVQPPAGEVWMLEFAFTISDVALSYHHYVSYYDYDGTTRRRHTLAFYRYATTAGYGLRRAHLELTRVITNTLYASLGFYHLTSATGRYGYSGFKLSEPLWSMNRLSDSNPAWKRKPTKALPAEIAALEPYAVEIYNPAIDDYELSIMLEEDTVLARDPATNFPVERLTIVITAEDLVSTIRERDEPELRLDLTIEVPTKYRGRKLRDLSKDEFEEYTGHKKYLERWRQEGIEI